MKNITVTESSVLLSRKSELVRLCACGERILTKDGSFYSKGRHTVRAEIDELIAFVKKDSDVIKCFKTNM